MKKNKVDQQEINAHATKIAHFFYRIQAGGGQAGYLYNLEAIKKEDALFAIVYHEKIDTRGAHYTRLYHFFDKISAFFPKAIRVFLHYIYYYLIFTIGLNLKKGYFDDLKNYEHIIFHSVKDFAQFKRSKQYDRTKSVSIMLHSPVSFSEEHCEVISEKHETKRFKAFFLEQFSKREVKYYAQADQIIIACKSAVDGYFYDDFCRRQQFVNLDFYELPTGLKALKTTEKRVYSRKKIGLEPNQIGVCFIGRYNEHKGLNLYNKLVEQAHLDPTKQEIKKKYIFYSAGSGKILPNHHIHNLGFRTDIADIINAMDLIINCNQFSYFDLLLLEAMSLSKAILATNVGGNKYLSTISKGIKLYNRNDLASTLEVILRIDREELIEMGKINNLKFEQYFSSQAFYKHHQQMARILLITSSAI